MVLNDRVEFEIRNKFIQFIPQGIQFESFDQSKGHYY